MNRRLLIAAALALLTATGTANARHHRSHRHWHHSHRAHFHVDANGNDARPAEWCGWFMRRLLHVADRAGNRALWWAHFGSRADGPHVGVIVVWNRGHGHGHVGIITEEGPQGFRVKSGNDGHAIRNRWRSVKGAYAFRWPT